MTFMSIGTSAAVIYIQNGVSGSYMDAIFKRLVHEESELWTRLVGNRLSKRFLTRAIFDDTEVKRTYTYRLYEPFPNIRGFPGFSGNDLTCANSGYQATLFFSSRDLGTRLDKSITQFY